MELVGQGLGLAGGVINIKITDRDILVQEAWMELALEGLLLKKRTVVFKW